MLVYITTAKSEEGGENGERQSVNMHIVHDSIEFKYRRSTALNSHGWPTAWDGTSTVGHLERILIRVLSLLVVLLPPTKVAISAAYLPSNCVYDASVCWCWSVLVLVSHASGCAALQLPLTCAHLRYGLE